MAGASLSHSVTLPISLADASPLHCGSFTSCSIPRRGASHFGESGDRANSLRKAYLDSFVTIRFKRTGRKELGRSLEFADMAPLSPLSPLDGCLAWSAGPLPPEAAFHEQMIHGSSTLNVRNAPKKRLLCLSNGHGEDAIAVAILKELQALAAERGEQLIVDGYPLVGLGNAYVRAGIRTLGPVREMPSGGFIYMDSWQLVKDVKAGLIDLLVDQWRTIARWVKKHPEGAVLAVGDSFPLAMAWLAERQRKLVDVEQATPGYGFVGTAKSEYYLRDEAGQPLAAHKRNIVESLISPEGVYLPWERALLAIASCRLVVPRDKLTVQMLQLELPDSARSKVLDLGNPMMDGLEPTGCLDDFLQSNPCDHCLAVLPGTRQPEAFGNWELLLECVKETVRTLSPKSCMFLVPLVPLLPLKPFTKALHDHGWRPLPGNTESYLPLPALERSSEPLNSDEGVTECTEHESVRIQGGSEVTAEDVSDLDCWPEGDGCVSKIAFCLEEAGEEHWDTVVTAKLVLVKGCFSDCVQQSGGGICMAGTGTEQLVGLGKPAFTLPGNGPQFTRAFAEAQSRLLGKSAVLCDDAKSLAREVPRVLADIDLLSEMAESGRLRLGEPGAGRRIAHSVWDRLLATDSF